MKVQTIEQDGQPVFAVIPYDEYEKLLNAAKGKDKYSNLDKIVAAIEAGEETFPLEFVEKLVETNSRLREWRKYRCLTQTQLASKARISQSAIATIELGKRVPNMNTGRRLADALKCDIDDLF